MKLEKIGYVFTSVDDDNEVEVNIFNELETEAILDQIPAEDYDDKIIDLVPMLKDEKGKLHPGDDRVQFLSREGAWEEVVGR